MNGELWKDLDKICLLDISIVLDAELSRNHFFLLKCLSSWPSQGLAGRGCGSWWGPGLLRVTLTLLGAAGHVGHVFTGKWPKQKRANLTTSMLLTSACITCANIWLVGPRGRSCRGTAHRCASRRVKPGAVISLTGLIYDIRSAHMD